MTQILMRTTSKNKRFFWGITGMIVLPLTLALELLLHELGLPAPIPVYMFPVLLVLAYSGIPGLLVVLLSSLPATALYVIALSYIERKWLLWMQAVVLMVNATVFVFLWGNGVNNEGIIYMTALAAIQAVALLAFASLTYLGIKKKIQKMNYAANLLFFVLFECCLFPLLIFEAEVQGVGIG